MVEVCRDIDQGLAALNRKIDEQNRRIRDLERNLQRCCNENNKPDNNNDDNSLEKRVKKLEKTSESLKEAVVQTLNNFADIENTNQELTQALQSLYEMVAPMIDAVSSVIEILGGDSE